METKDEELLLDGKTLRQLQLNELELVVEVDRICRKYGIQYSLDGGTLLGAIRHKGFIPWDDDADLIFTRHEYAKFYRACKKELRGSKFFLQEWRTDPYYRWGYAKLRNRSTEYIRAGQEHMKYQTGVCVDLFVVDHVPDSRILRGLFYYYNLGIRKILYSELGMVQAKSAGLRRWYGLLYKIPRNLVFRARNAVAGLVNLHSTELVSHLGYQYPKRCRYGMPATCFEDYIEIEFEGMKFMGFRQYDLYLRTHYGDYMTLPPKEQQRGYNNASTMVLSDITLEAIQAQYAHNHG